MSLLFIVGHFLHFSLTHFRFEVASCSRVDVVPIIVIESLWPITVMSAGQLPRWRKTDWDLLDLGLNRSQSAPPRGNWPSTDHLDRPHFYNPRYRDCDGRLSWTSCNTKFLTGTRGWLKTFRQQHEPMRIHEWVERRKTVRCFRCHRPPKNPALRATPPSPDKLPVPWHLMGIKT